MLLKCGFVLWCDEEESYETVRRVVSHPMSDAKNGARAFIISNFLSIMSYTKRVEAHKARAKGRKTKKTKRKCQKTCLAHRTANAARKTILVRY